MGQCRVLHELVNTMPGVRGLGGNHMGGQGMGGSGGGGLGRGIGGGGLLGQQNKTLGGVELTFRRHCLMLIAHIIANSVT